MDLIETDTDPWIVAYEACERVAREIMENLNLRDREKISSQNYNAISAKIRIRLKQFSNETNELKEKLNMTSMFSKLTPKERERRQRQIEALISKEVQLMEKFNQKKRNEDFHSTYIESRAQLMGKKGKSTVFADIGTTSWGDINRSHNEESDFRPISEMTEEQQRLLKEQDEGLETLLKIISAQTQVATTINNEVEHHNEILVDIRDDMERVDDRIDRASKMVKIIEKKESIWGYWLVAFLLLLAILGVTFA